MKIIIWILGCLSVVSVLSSCGFQKSVAISKTGGKTNVSGGVLHPATNEPVIVDISPEGK